MNKKVILFFTAIFSIMGAYVPLLLGDSSLISGWSILGGFVGGMAGIWLGAVISKRWG
ncbi:MAG TPA: hypothetical protein VFM68_01900 [Candidatus Saccharimonadales bacterium]|nr:hypothetical protein [Candidatus Saccharimonadales bacterium]